MNRIALGKRLREERLHCGLTQEQVAEAINVSTTYIGLIEHGERSVTLDKLIALSLCFHVSVDYLLQEDIPLTNSTQEKQLLSLWHSASTQQREMILSVIRSIVHPPQQK